MMTAIGFQQQISSAALRTKHASQRPANIRLGRAPAQVSPIVVQAVLKSHIEDPRTSLWGDETSMTIKIDFKTTDIARYGLTDSKTFWHLKATAGPVFAKLMKMPIGTEIPVILKPVLTFWKKRLKYYEPQIDKAAVLKMSRK
jgi:hypothetical protein